MGEAPDRLPKAWRVRAVPLTGVVALLGVAARARWGAAGGALVQAMPLLFVAVPGAALWLDWQWLKRNHHRVNEWGLSKGGEARKKPE